MMTTKFVIQMKIPSRPDLDYFYRGQNKEGCPVFGFKTANAKKYNTAEEAYRDRSILMAVEKADTFTVMSVRCRI